MNRARKIVALDNGHTRRVAQHFVGGVDEVVPKVQAFLDAGCRHVVIMALDAAPSTATTEGFLREVVPAISVPG